MMPKDERRSIKEGEGRERNLASQGVTAIYIGEKGKFRPRAGNNITRATARHTFIKEIIQVQGLLIIIILYTAAFLIATDQFLNQV